MVVTLLVAALPGSASSQCCSPGNPSSGNQLLGSGGGGAWRLLSFYQYGYSDTYYHGNDPSDFRVFESADYHYLGLNLDYGFTDRTLAHLETGYFPMRRRNHPNASLSETVRGPSNGVAGLRHIFLPFSGRSMGWEAGVGLKFPLRLEPVSRNGRALADEIQPSTRAFGGVADAAAQWGRLDYGLRLIAYLRFEWTFENQGDYAYGHLFSPMAMGTWSQWGWIVGQQFRGEWRTPDRLNGRQQASTGSRLLWWEPEAGFELSPALRLSVAGGIPLYRDFRGTQLAAGYSAQIKAMFLIPGKRLDI